MPGVRNVGNVPGTAHGVAPDVYAQGSCNDVKKSHEFSGAGFVRNHCTDYLGKVDPLTGTAATGDMLCKRQGTTCEAKYIKGFYFLCFRSLSISIQEERYKKNDPTGARISDVNKNRFQLFSSRSTEVRCFRISYRSYLSYLPYRCLDV